QPLLPAHRPHPDAEEDLQQPGAAGHDEDLAGAEDAVRLAVRGADPPRAGPPAPLITGPWLDLAQVTPPSCWRLHGEWRMYGRARFPSRRSPMNAKPVERPEDLLERHDHDDSGHLDDDELIDMESDQSFPASDPPGWTLGTTRTD